MRTRNTRDNKPAIRATQVFGLAILAGCLAACASSKPDEAAFSPPPPPSVGYYTQILQRNPHDSAAQEGLAELLEQQGDNQEAALHYKALTEQMPQNADFHCAYGRVLLKLKRAQEARTQYEEALVISPRDKQALNGFGVALDYLGDHEHARMEYKKELAEAPGDLATLNNLAHSYMLSADYIRAAKLLAPHANDPDASATLKLNLAEAERHLTRKARARLERELKAERLAAAKKAPKEKSTESKPAEKEGPPAAFAPVAPAPVKPAEIPVSEPPASSAYAELGGFGTAQLAQERADKIKARFSNELSGLAVAVASAIDESDGTPVYHVRINGFADQKTAKAFCASFRKHGVYCKARGD